MLELARKYQKSIGDKLGYHNVEFRRGKIQDLKTNLELLDQHLQDNPVRSVADLSRLEEFETRIRREQPLIADESIDVIVSNCVLNLVRPEDKKAIVRRDVPRAQARRPGGDLRYRQRRGGAGTSGARSRSLERLCVRRFSRRRVSARFRRSQVSWHPDRRVSVRAPYQTVEGIEFRAITVTAYKGKEGPCIERNQAVIYRGPWKQVVDDDGHTLERGARMAVCDKTFKLYSQAALRRAVHSRAAAGRSRCWKTPAFLTARAITSAIRARPKAWSSRLHRLSGGVCGPGLELLPVEIQKKNERANNNSSFFGKEKKRVSPA